MLSSWWLTYQTGSTETYAKPEMGRLRKWPEQVQESVALGTSEIEHECGGDTGGLVERFSIR